MTPPVPEQDDAAGRLAVDNPEAYIAGDRRRALAAGEDLPDRVSGSALFADISGFTPLTEALVREAGAHRGAEMLSAVLDRVFAAVLSELHRHGGSAIYFSGDAVTCWLDGDDGALAVGCGLAMQDRMADVGRIVLPSGAVVPLALKVAVAGGTARRFVVGDPSIQLIDVLAGRLMDELADAEQHAEPGEIVVQPATLTALGERVVCSQVRPGGFGVVTALTAPPSLPDPPPSTTPLPERIVRQWLLPEVYRRMRTGRGEFLAELRPAIPLFLRFGGIDFDSDAARPVLDDFVRQAQQIIDRYGGNALQLTLGDKGAYLYAVFGSPVAHEDDAARACAAALELRRLDEQCAVTGLQIGISQGRCRSGTYGHRLRRTFCCLGDAVNLAARLMSRAPAGSVYVSEAVRRASTGRFRWTPLPPMTVKGKAAPIVAFALEGQRSEPTRHRRHVLPLIGRVAERQVVAAAIEDTLAGHGRVVAVTGEAGVGKSRLLADAAQQLTARALPGIEGEAQPYGTTSAYTAWRPVWAGLLGVHPDDPAAGLADRLAGRLAPGLRDRVPLLGPVLGVDLPDNDLTGPLDAKLRKASLEQLLVAHLSAEATRTGGLAILLEDCQWLDPLSQDLLVAVARALVDLPVLLLLAYRDDAADWHGTLQALAHTRLVPLDVLDEAAVGAVIDARCAALFGLETAPAGLRELILDRGEGNPFHIEELLNFVHAQGVDPTDPVALARLDVPESMHSLVLSRLDLLAEPARRTAKVASVVGRLFDTPTLLGSYPELGDASEVDDELGALRAADLVLLESAETHSHLFRHSVTRDVAYESLPFALREELHARIGRYLEAFDSASPDGVRRLDLLAYHFGRSADTAKKLEYLVLAGEAAQAAYSNAVAADYLRQALPLLPPAERGPVRRRLGSVLELVGEWAQAEQVYAEAMTEAADDPRAVVAARLGLVEVARKQGRYAEAGTQLDLVEAQLRETDDPELAGQALHLAGTLAAQQGRYPQAREHYTASLEIRRALRDQAREAALLSNLGILAEYERDYAAARALNEQALALRTAIGDRWAIGISLTNVGMIALLQDDPLAAREAFAESMRLMRQVGDPWMVAVGHHNLGNTLRGLGDRRAAADHLVDALTAYVGFDDAWSQALLFEDIATLGAVPESAREAGTLLGAADGLRERLGAPRPPGLQAELDAVVSRIETAIGADVGTVRAAGAELDLEQAVAVARAVCAVASQE